MRQWFPTSADTVPKCLFVGKPIRFGYKIWSLCGEDGYPYHLKIYTGKEPGQQPDPLGNTCCEPYGVRH